MGLCGNTVLRTAVGAVAVVANNVLDGHQLSRSRRIDGSKSGKAVRSERPAREGSMAVWFPLPKFFNNFIYL